MQFILAEGQRVSPAGAAAQSHLLLRSFKVGRPDRARAVEGDADVEVALAARHVAAVGGLGGAAAASAGLDLGRVCGARIRRVRRAVPVSICSRRQLIV